MMSRECARLFSICRNRSAGARSANSLSWTGISNLGAVLNPLRSSQFKFGRSDGQHKKTGCLQVAADTVRSDLTGSLKLSLGAAMSARWVPLTLVGRGIGRLLCRARPRKGRRLSISISRWSWAGERTPICIKGGFASKLLQLQFALFTAHQASRWHRISRDASRTLSSPILKR